MRAGLCGAGLAVLTFAWTGAAMVAPGPFSAHMLAHIALVAIAAPLLAGAVTGLRVDPARFAPRVFAPIPASMLELVIVWAWHVPALHVAARAQTAPYVAEQASFLAAGLLLWLAALRTGAGVVALLFTSMHMTLLGALFALSPRVLYAEGHGHAAAAALADQHLGGVIMLIVGGGADLAGGLWVTRRLLRPRLAAAALLALVAAAAACGDARADAIVPGGDAARGADVIRARDCGTCHRIPGIRGADGLVAAPLTLMARRMYIAGRVPNEPEAMVRWILSPQEIDPRTAMPDFGLTEQQARDVAAYLYTLR
jgi:putative membrane protein